MTDKLRAACIALLKSAPDHITNEHWPELDEIVKALVETSAQNAINWHHPECEGACFACLIEKLVKKEYGTSGLNYLLKALDQLPDATEMIDKDFALNVALEALHNFADDKSADGWKAIDAIGVVRKALAEPDMGIDRGAWSDVPDATKWLDELRGDEPETITATELAERINRGEKWKLLELPNSITGVVERKTANETPKAGPVAHMNREGWITYGNAPGYDIPLYTAPPKREWQGLTAQEKTRIRDSVPYTQFMSAGEYAMKVQHATEAELREKNT